MRWRGAAEPFVAWCLETPDPRAFDRAVRSVPAADRPAVVARLSAALARPGPGEPEAEQLRPDTALVGRMRSPAAVLRRQIKLEKRRLLEALEEG